ncbi:MAG: hypothetical protein QOE61_55, partial [Micromonosporaceae bacterium]|nr:hypothetical protein [Micromonosporaceae bacterium]
MSNEPAPFPDPAYDSELREAVCD